MALLLKKRKQTLASRTNVSQAFVMVHRLLQPSPYPGSGVHESEERHCVCPTWLPLSLDSRD